MFVLMTSIEDLIGNLLLRHNCVIVPSFGGFVAKPVSAKIDYKKGTMLPPSKSLLFNKQLINNDGLLINELALANSSSFDSASEEVREKVSVWQASLKRGERIELDRIGHLYFDEEQNICFEQDRFFNLLLESFGLGQVHFLTQEKTSVIEEKVSLVPEKEVAVITEQEETPIIPISTPLKKKEIIITEPRIGRNRKKIRRYVAAACFLPFAFYSIWIPVKTDVLESGVLSIRDFNPFHKTSEGVYFQSELTSVPTSTEEEQSTLENELSELPSDVKVYSYKYSDDFYIPVQLIETTDEIPPVDETPEEAFNPNAVNYIVGCFGDKTNATNMVLKLNNSGLDARILDVNNGLHRVTAGSAISNESLQSIKSQVEGLGLVGWTLK